MALGHLDQLWGRHSGADLALEGNTGYIKQRFDPHAAAKVTTAKIRLELGNTSSVKWFDGMGEYVIDWGPGYRIYLA